MSQQNFLSQANSKESKDLVIEILHTTMTFKLNTPKNYVTF